MRKPSNKATQGKKPGARTVSPSERPEDSPHSRPASFLGKLKEAAEVLGAAIAVVVVLHDIFQQPQIHAQTAQISAPFSLSFSLHNPSWVLPIGDVRVECFVKDARTDIVVLANIQNDSIPSGETVQYNCPLDAAFTNAGSGNVQTAQLLLKAKFKTLSIERDTHSEMFNWNPISRNWTEGESIN